MSAQPAPASPLLRFAAVAAGGFLGGCLRYLGLHLGVTTHHGVDMTSLNLANLVDIRLLLINTLGVFIATRLLLGPMGKSLPDAPQRLFWTTGVLGGLTTYSSLVNELGHSWSLNPTLTLIAALVNLGAASLAVVLAIWFRQRGS